MLGRKLAAVGVATATMLALAACGDISQSEVEKQVSAALQQKVGVKPDKIDCPSDMPAKVGAKMRCTLTNDGESIGLTVKITSTSGTSAHFEVQVDQKK